MLNDININIFLTREIKNTNDSVGEQQMEQDKHFSTVELISIKITLRKNFFHWLRTVNIFF